MLRCIKGHDVQVYNSAAGFYIGTYDKEGYPHCRISTKYYKSRDKAQKDLDKIAFMDRLCEENLFCHGGRGCQIREDQKAQKV